MSAGFIFLDASLFYVMFHEIQCNREYMSEIRNKWDKVFKNRPSEVCGRQPLKNLK